MLNGKRICVVLPAYNAAETLEMTYNEIPFDIVDDVVLVDELNKWVVKKKKKINTIKMSLKNLRIMIRNLKIKIIKKI